MRTLHIYIRTKVTGDRATIDALTSATASLQDAIRAANGDAGSHQISDVEEPAAIEPAPLESDRVE